MLCRLVSNNVPSVLASILLTTMAPPQSKRNKVKKAVRLGFRRVRDVILSSPGPTLPGTRTTTPREDEEPSLNAAPGPSALPGVDTAAETANMMAQDGQLLTSRPSARHSLAQPGTITQNDSFNREQSQDALLSTPRPSAQHSFSILEANKVDEVRGLTFRRHSMAKVLFSTGTQCIS